MLARRVIDIQRSKAQDAGMVIKPSILPSFIPGVLDEFPKAVDGRRVRKSTRRSRRGCIICRIRHVKCDEVRPFCTRCTRTGRKCDGYADESSEVDPSSAITLMGTQDEKRSLAYMRQCALPELLAYFESDFWERSIFQRSIYQPAVNHAIIAFGAIHETLRQEARQDASAVVVRATRRLALQQYSQAVRLLSTELTRPSRETMELALVCCLLFICFENVIGNQAGAVQHIENGLRICNEWSDRDVDTPCNQSSNDFRSYLLPMFAHLDNQAAIFLPFRQPKLKVKENFLAQPSVSTKLSTLREAKTALHTISKQIVSFLTVNHRYRQTPASEIPKPIISEFSRLQEDWRTLGLRLDAFVRSNSNTLSARDVRGCYVSKMLQHSISIMLSSGLQTVPQPNGLGPASHQARHEAVVALGKSLLESLKRSASTTGAGNANGLPLFTLEYSIVPPLYYVVAECGDLETRRAAVALLEAYPAREGLWEARTAAVIARRRLFAGVKEDSGIEKLAEFYDVEEGEAPEADTLERTEELAD